MTLDTPAQAAETGSGDTLPNDLSAFWMPFTPNRHFKERPRLVSRAEGAYYYGTDGRKIFDGTSGLWCTNAGHSRKPIVEAIKAQAGELDYAPSFQFSHPKAFEVASRLADMAPAGLEHVFFANSGSEAGDTALKIALAYHRVRGEGARFRLIGRERGYHGTGFGGISVGGIVGNRKLFGSLLAGVDHLPHTHAPEHQAFSKGDPAWGAHLADDLERIVALHDASTIAAVMVEPMAGSTGVLPCPQGYLKRLREICDKHGILLIFDEVITGFGRLGHGFAAERYGVTPDIITFAKGVTNGAVPMGGVIVKKEIYDAFANEHDHVVELCHGYTYSAHPLACAAALASMDLYRDEGLYERALALESHFEDCAHALRAKDIVIDIRNSGLAAAVEVAPRKGAAGARGYDALQECFHTEGFLIRIAGDSLVVCPPLIATEDEITWMFEGLGRVIDRLS